MRVPEPTIRMPEAMRVPEPVVEPSRPEPRPDVRSTLCMPLWAEYDRHVQLAAQAAEEALKAAEAAAAVQAEADSAVKAAQDAKAAHEALVQEAAQVTADLARLEKAPKQVDGRLQQETSHAAYLSFRRGDINADELREVFRRAEGWTPEHERLTKRSTELRLEETAAAKARIAAERAVKPAQDKARTALPAAQAAAETAQANLRAAATAAEARKANAENCERNARR
jgi:hypothetical protein